MSLASFPTEFLPPVIDDENYEFIRKTVYEHSRIDLGSCKKALVSARLTKRLRALKLPDFSAYCRLLRSTRGKEELRNLVDVMSTNHTGFFREASHFDFLRDVAIPKWRARGLGAARIWSAACSSGEEPYSIGIVLTQSLGLGSDWRIFATDISARMLDVARDGIYAADRLAQVPEEAQRRYFLRGKGANDGEFRVKDALRQRIEFAQINLLGEYNFSATFDAIFCRNVMIYFDRTTQETLIRKLVPRLERGGYLMIGHSETLSAGEYGLKGVEPAVFQRV